MAGHTLDTKAQIAAATTNPQAVNYTCGAGTTLLVVTLIYANGSRTGAPTYNGVALTQADQTRYAASSPEARAELWYMIGPPTGSAYSLSVPNPNALSLEVCISSFIASAGFGSVFHMAGGGQSNGAANPSVSLTTTMPSLLVAVVASGHDTFAPSARTGTSLYETDNGTWGGGHQFYQQAALGAQAMSWTQASEDYGAVVVAFGEVRTGINVTKALPKIIYGPKQGITLSKANAKVIYRPHFPGINISKANVKILYSPTAVPSFKAAWAIRRQRTIGGGLL